MESTGDDEVETVDVGDSHEKFLESSRDRRLLSFHLEEEAGTIVSRGSRIMVDLWGATRSLLGVRKALSFTLKS